MVWNHPAVQSAVGSLPYTYMWEQFGIYSLILSNQWLWDLMQEVWWHEVPKCQDIYVNLVWQTTHSRMTSVIGDIQPTARHLSSVTTHSMTSVISDKQPSVSAYVWHDVIVTHIGTGRWLNDFVKRCIRVNGLHVLAEYVNLLVTIPTSGAVVVQVRPVWSDIRTAHTH